MHITRSFDNRMRELESANNIVSDPTKPIIIRADGSNFSSFCKRNFNSNFDMDMQIIMNKAMQHTVALFPDIDFAFTNSDEITFVMMPKAIGYYNYSGRVQKLASLIASAVAVKFNELLHHDELALFDARVFQTDSNDQLLDALTWRQASCERNAISTYAREVMTQPQMNGLSSAKLEATLIEMGLPPMPRDGFYYGFFITRKRPHLPIITAKGSISEIANVYLITQN